MASLMPPARTIEERASAAKSPTLKVLAVIDGTERTGRIVDYALGLRSRAHGLQLVVLGVVPQPATGRLRGYGTFKQAEVYGGLIDTMRQRAVSAVARRLDQENVAHIDRIEVGDPVATILRVGREEDADLIVLGDGPAGVVQRILPAIGLSVATVTSQVVQLTTVPVVVVK
jgi:nucleotide-binding universal stress UspA family protein